MAAQLVPSSLSQARQSPLWPSTAAILSLHSSIPRALPVNEDIRITQNPLHRSLFHIKAFKSTAESDMTTYAAVLASRAPPTEGDSNPATEALLPLTRTIIYRSVKGKVRSYEAGLSHQDGPSLSPEPEHQYVQRAQQAYRSWSRVYELLGIKDTMQKAFRQTVLDIKDASLATKFSPHNVNNAECAADATSWALFDGLVEEWLMKWGPVMWSDPGCAMPNSREAWIDESERGGETTRAKENGSNGGNLMRLLRQDEENNAAGDFGNESDEEYWTAEEDSEGADEFEDEGNDADDEEAYESAREKSGLWWSDRKDRAEIRLTMRELFKYLGNNAYDARNKILSKKSGGEPIRKKVKPRIREYIEEHGKAPVPSVATSGLKRSVREIDLQSSHDGDLNHGMVEQQSEEGREQKRVKYVSAEERDREAREMERKYPYGFGLGNVWEKIRRGEYPARDGSAVENNSGEGDGVPVDYAARWRTVN